MIKHSLLLIFLALSSVIQAQTIGGKIIDDKGKPVMAANVYFKSSPDKGTTSNIDGSFLIPFTNDKDTLYVCFIGYETETIPAYKLKTDADNIIILRFDSLMLGEVVVLGATPISEQFSTEKLSSLDIYLNPTSQADPLKAIINMPASTNSDESANPSLRGSSSDRSRVIYNGVPVYRPVRASSLNNIGFFSIFNPEMIDVQTVYPSNPPLISGNVSGGIVDITTIKKIDENKYQFSSGIGNIGFSMAQKLKGESTFLQTYGNWQNSFLMKKINDKSLPDMKKYDTKDIGLNLRYTINDKMYFNSYNYFMTEYYEGVSSLLSFKGDLKSNGTRYFSINNLTVFSKNGMFNFNYGYNFEKKDVLFGNNNLNSKDNSHFVSFNYKKEIVRNLTLQTGISYDNQNISVRNEVPKYYYAMNEGSPVKNQDTIISNYILEPYLYMSWDLNKKISMSMGARTNIPLNNQKNYVSLQYSLKYVPVSNHSLIFSAGQYHNYTQPDYYNLMYRLLKSRQVSLDYLYEKKHTKIQAALYYKQESGEQGIDFYYTINKTRTYGFEFSISQTIWNYLTISLSNSTIKQTVDVDGLVYRGGYNYGYFLKPSITYNNPKLFSVGLMYIGRPGTYLLRYPIVSSNWNNEANAYEPYYSQLTEIQNGAYNRLDLSFSKYMSFKKCSLTVYLTINNLLNTKNETNDIFYSPDYASTYKEYYPLRTFYFGFVFAF